MWAVLTGLAVTYGASLWLAGSRFNRRGAEYVFYQTAGRMLPRAGPLILLYDDWDRDAYPTPFGPIPHDLAVRLYYLNRSACWHFDAKALADHQITTCPLHDLHNAAGPMMIIGRDRDLPALKQVGQVEVLAHSSAARWDRTYLLARVQPNAATPNSAAMELSHAAQIRR